IAGILPAALALARKVARFAAVGKPPKAAPAATHWAPFAIAVSLTFVLSKPRLAAAPLTGPAEFPTTEIEALAPRMIVVVAGTVRKLLPTARVDPGARPDASTARPTSRTMRGRAPRRGTRTIRSTRLLRSQCGSARRIQDRSGRRAVRPVGLASR